MESKTSNMEVNMDLPPYRAFPKSVGTRKMWAVGVSVAMFLVMIIVAGTLVGVYMTQKHTEEIWKQEKSPRAASPPCKFYHIHSHDILGIDSLDPGSFGTDLLQFPSKELCEILRGAMACSKHDTPLEIRIVIPFGNGSCDLIEDLLNTLSCNANQRNKRHALGGAPSTEGESGQPEEKPPAKCIAETDNLIDVVGKKVDDIISAWLLDLISKTADDYRINLKKIVKLLKPGGRLILVGGINASYYNAKEEKLDLLSYDESFVNNVVVEEGMEITSFETYPGKPKGNAAVYKKYFLLVAVKPE